MSDDQSSLSSPATTPSSARPFMPLPLELNGERRKPSKKLSFQGCQTGQPPVIPDPTRERIRMQAAAGKLQIAPNQTYDFTSDDLIDEGEIGRGAFGAVNRMKFTHTDTVMAVKRIRSTVDEKEQKQLLMDLEVVMKSNDCNTIVTFYGALFKEGDCWICMELMDTSLDKFYKFICECQQSRIPEPILAQITFATVRALNYLKEELKIIHRDVKPSNILLKRNGDIKLCDFGISGQLVDSIARTKDAGCRPYMAPERIDPQRAKGYDVRSDVWSLGITLMEVATGKFPYPKWGSVFEQLSQVVEGDPPRLSTTYNGMEFSIDFVNFVNTCLIKDERDRPKYGRLLQHAFIQHAEKSDTDVAAYVSEVLESMANNGITQFTTNLPAEVESYGKRTKKIEKMRIHTVPQRRVPSAISLEDPLDPSMMDTSVPAVFPPALRRYPFNGLTPGEEYGQEQSPRTIGGGSSRTIPTVSERIGSYGRRSNNYDENGIEVQLANGDLAMIGNRLCREDSGISINEQYRVGDEQEGRFERLKKICSFATLSSGGGSDMERFNGVSRSQHWMLMVTPVVSSFSLALVIAAVVGPQWLLTEEKIPVTTYHNSTHGPGTPVPTSTSIQNQQQLNILHPHLIPATKDDPNGAFLTKYTKSSLWMLCSKYSGSTTPGQPPHQLGDEFQCSSIDYFPTEGYSPDPNDSTNAIPYTVTHSSPFFLASNGVLIVSYGLFLVAMCSTKHKICYFVSGVLFIISGLLMLIGLIMYISILKAEIGSKLRPRSSLQAPQFTFRYGQSFLLYVFGFIITELSGILNVLIYSNVQQDEYDSMQHADQSSNFPTYQNLSGGIQYNLHYQRREWAPRPGEEPAAAKDGGTAIVDYRYPYDGLECDTSQRYYFEQEQQQLPQQREQQDDHEEADCRLHRRAYGRMTHDGMSKSLTDLLYTEPAQVKPDKGVTWSRIRTNGDGQRTDQGVDSESPEANQEYSHYWSSSGKLTRSVSTYTDLLPVSGLADDGDESSKRHRRVRTQSPSRSDDENTEKVSNICGLPRHYLSRELSKEKLFNEFCKKVGPRPKPKNIYYIESDGRNVNDSYRSVFVVEPSSPLGTPGRNRSSSTQRRRNSMADTNRRRLTPHDQLPHTVSNYRQRIHSDNSLDDLAHESNGQWYGLRRDPIGRARSLDYRQTLPRNFQQRHLAASEPEDETGGFGERIAALEKKRISASGLLLDPAR
uniref:mitogen-activated protein kinase kinase n=1 Tax=Anopheles epiroticus TaxID=199890 RepID=A0A182PCV7_9DIPT